MTSMGLGFILSVSDSIRLIVTINVSVILYMMYEHVMAASC